MKNYFKYIAVAILIPFYKKTIVIGMILVGALFFPEASQILRHYCFGDGSNLYLRSDYIQQSPVIKKHLRHLKEGKMHKVGMHQWEDWRLAYALNPFQMIRKKNKIIVQQYIKFDQSNDVLTWFGPIPLPDNIVHTF
ncbi:MAG: hypothetical protein RI995_2082, partial [Bacteroidota bacterium]